MASTKARSSSDPSLRHIAGIMYQDTKERLAKIVGAASAPLVAMCSLPRRALAMPTAAPAAFDPSNATMVESDVQFLIQYFNFWQYKGQVDWIRNTSSLDQCLTRLSVVLTSEGPLRNAESGGTTGALSLLPTAGALIGAPAKELWAVYKLMPVAGFLSMLLSLGGNIVPTNSSDYTIKANTLSYGGFIRTSQPLEQVSEFEEEPLVDDGTEAQQFARKVQRRSNDFRGSQKRTTIAIGISLQLFWIAILIGACWFVEIGTVVVWWCQAWGWMLFWYLMVAISSVLENMASVPFTKQWTIRASKAPEVTISPDAPIIARSAPVRVSKDLRHATFVTQTAVAPDMMSKDGTNTNFDEIELQPMIGSPYLTSRQSTHDMTSEAQPLRKSYTNSSILPLLEQGINSTGTVVVDPTIGQARSIVPFYVIISLEGVSAAHATFRVISKAISVGVFAAGTAIFASSTLTSISVGLTVLCLVLGAGVFGRVVSMWMASELMRENPILHKVVQSPTEAADYINEVLALPGITFELMGHIIVDGRCIHRYNKLFRWATLFGILAAPFDITKLAVSRPKQFKDG